jgi:hypothetical protein
MESALHPLREWPYEGVTPECAACAPAIAIRRGVLARDGGVENFLPRTVVTIRGARFAGAGNTVIVEQGGQRLVAAKDNAWSESPAQITAALPATLQAGWAILYVIHANGQESKAQPITIARGLPTFRKPIRRGEGGRGGQ